MTGKVGLEAQTGVGRSRAELRPETGKLPRCAIWAVLNVTPDSFSDGGRYLDPRAATEAGRRMAGQGATVIDVGGASSRPAGATYGVGATPVPPEEESARVVPVVRALAGEELTVSIDTCRGAVAEAALRAGARIVNDVSMGADPALLAAVAAHHAQLVLMHTRGDGRVEGEHVRYGDVVLDVARELGEAIGRARQAGVERIWIDPGLGFAKTAAQSTELLARLPELIAQLPQHPVLVGASRKSFLARLAPTLEGEPPPPTERLAASLAAAGWAARARAAAVRVHDVAATRQALLVDEALARRSEVARV